MSHYPIPEAVLARHIACVGETGSGKTYDTKSIVEHLAAEGHRVCVLDTIKSDWWGMISSASGKKAGLPFRIIGGPRGHVPLHAGAGKALGELVANGNLPLSIIDMADLGGAIPEMPAPGMDLVEFWAAKISGAGPMLRALAAKYPQTVTREELAAELDMAASGGTFSTYISRLRTPGLIEVTRDGVRASDALMVGA